MNDRAAGCGLALLATATLWAALAWAARHLIPLTSITQE